MVKPEARNNITFDPEIASYEDLKSILNNEKDIQIRKLFQEIEKLKTDNLKFKSENNNLQSEMSLLLQSINKLSNDNSDLKKKSQVYKNHKQRKKISLEDNVLQKFKNFFEQSLINEQINHYKLKQEIEFNIKNLSDREVLYFILQQTIIYKRGMVILKIKDIVEGVKSKTVTWTKGTGLDKKTVSKSLESLENMKLIFRYTKNKHKVIYFLNIEKCNEILEKLNKKEIDFEDVEEFLNVHMRTKKYSFFDFPLKIESGDLPHSMENTSTLKEENFPVKRGTLPLSENLEEYDITGLHKLSTIPINNIINSNINNKQTTIEKSEPSFVPGQNEKTLLLQELLQIWKINEQLAASLLSKKGQKLSSGDFVLALKEKISILSNSVINENRNINHSSAKSREKFFKMLYETNDLLGLDMSFDTQESINNILLNIDESLMVK